MHTLRDIDKVAFVRFASVYRDFHEVEDFEKIIGDLGGELGDGLNGERL